MTYVARSYAEIAAARRAAILVGAKLVPKGACHFCAWPFQLKELFCCSDCAIEYHAEAAALERKA